MKALVLEQAGKIAIEDREFSETLGDDDVQIKIHSVGICGSDVHYYQHGRIGPFVVKAPMVLGHEASGVVLALGKNVKHLSIGDRVCMEPGIPDMQSPQSRAGIYNLDPAVQFWATPPVHGCLRETVIHPGAFTFKLPDNVSFAEGAMVEPLAIGMHASTKTIPATPPRARASGRTERIPAAPTARRGPARRCGRKARPGSRPEGSSSGK